MEANESYEKSIKCLIDRIQYLANKGSLADKSIALYERIINDIISYVNILEHSLDSALMDIYNAGNRHILMEECYQDYIERLEAICLMHGISNFERLARRSKTFLLQTALMNEREHCYQLPFQFVKPISYSEFRNMCSQIREAMNGESIN